MRATDLEGLLAYGESDWLDFKAELHFGIEQPGADRAARQEGQGALLKDLMCLANSPSPGRTRFLVRGVKDLKSVRQVTGVTTHLDDANVQGWLAQSFDPPLRVQYWQWAMPEGRFVGVFEIRTLPGVVYVPARSLGRALTEGQVWWRQGSRNTLAGRAGLEVLFGPPRPVMQVGWQVHGGGTHPGILFDAKTRERLQQVEAGFPAQLRAAVAHLAQTAALPMEHVDRPTDVLTYAGRVPVIDAHLNQHSLKLLNADLKNWGVPLDIDLESLGGLWSNRSSVWPGVLSGLEKVDGPGLRWYTALEEVVNLLEEHSYTLTRVRTAAEQPRLTLQITNIGAGTLKEGRLRLIPQGNTRFQWPVTLKRLFAPAVGEPRPGASGAEILLGDLPSQTQLPISGLSLRRTLGQTSHLRYEITGGNLAQTICGQLSIA